MVSLSDYRFLQPVTAAAVSAVALAAVAAAHAPASAPKQDISSVPAEQVNVAVPDFAELAAQVKPAVVSVNVKRVGATDESEPEAQSDGNPFEGTPFEKFFNRRAPDQKKPQAEPQDKVLSWVAGSGFFISADGYAVTNNHVVDGARKVEVVGDDGVRYAARVIGTDPKTDLALIKAEGRSDFPFVKLSVGKPRIGEWAMAVGNPFGLGGTVTRGIVSAEGRDIGSGPYDDYIQIDAPINKGNSGGPTFNLRGEVIGVNTAIYSPSGGSVGIAFDIPANIVAKVIPLLKANGRIERGWVGVSVQDVTRDVADSVGLKEAQGALIVEAVAKGPASQAGLKPGDIVQGIDSTAIKDSHDLARRVADLKPRTTVSMTLWRQGHEKRVRLTVEGDASDGKPLAFNSKE